MRSNTPPLTQQTKKNVEQLIERGYKEQLKTAAEAGDVEKYKKLIQNIHAHTAASHSKGECDAVCRLAYEFPLDKYGYTAFGIAKNKRHTRLHDHLSKKKVEVTAVRPSSYLQMIIDSSDVAEFQIYIGTNSRWFERKIDNLPIVHTAAGYCSANFFAFVLHVYVAATQSSLQRVLDLDGDGFGNRPLHCAASHCNVDTINLILSLDVNPNVQNKLGETPLHLVAKRTSLHTADAFAALMKHGADLSLKDCRGMRADQLVSNNGRNPAHYERLALEEALKKGNIILIKRYVNENPTWLYLPSFFPIAQLDVLIEACEGLSEKKKPVLKPWLNSHSAPDTQSLVGRWAARRGGSFAQLQWLIDHGADLNAVHTAEGDTFLHLCVGSQNHTVLEALFFGDVTLPKAIDFHATNKRSETALQVAVRLGYVETVALLLRAGAGKPEDFFPLVEYVLKNRTHSHHLKILTLLFQYNTRPFSTTELDQLLRIAVDYQLGEEIFSFLLAKPNADINWKNPTGDDGTLIRYAVNLKVPIKLLEFLRKNGADLNVVDRDGSTLLHYAAFKSLEMVNYLVEQGLSLTTKNFNNVLVEKGTRYSLTNIVAQHKKAIFKYVRGNSISKPEPFSKAWLNLNYDTELGFTVDGTLIHTAAAHNNVPALQELRTAYGDEWATVVNQQKNNAGGFRTPLGSAIIKRSTDAIEYLLKNGADPSIACIFDENNSGSLCAPVVYCKDMDHHWLTAVYGQFLACIKAGGSAELSEFINKWNPTWLKVVDFKGRTPLHHAVLSGNTNTIQWLLAQGVDKNAQDNDGNTAFHLAVKSENLAIIAQLKRFGVDQKIENKKGETAEAVRTGFFWFSKNIIQTIKEEFDEAVRFGNIERVIELFEAHADLLRDELPAILTRGSLANHYLNQQSSEPLCVAVKNKDLNAVQQLLDSGADVNVDVSPFATPLMISVYNGSDDITELLLCAGADVVSRLMYQYSYPYQKATLILDIITLSNELLVDVKKLSEFRQVEVDTSSLRPFNEAADAIILPEWIKKYGIPKSHNKIFTNDGFKGFFKIPFITLEAERKRVKENNEAYKKTRAELLKPLVDPLLDRFNALFTGKNRYKTLKEGIRALYQVDSQRASRLNNSRYKSIGPSLNAFDKLASEKRPINKSTFDCINLSAEKFETIANAVPTLETNLAQLEADFAQAKQDICAEQKDAYALLVPQIEQLNTLMDVLPSSALDASSLSRPSLRDRAKPCQLAIIQLQSLQGVVVENPSVDFLKDNQTHLKNLQDQLPALLFDLTEAKRRVEKDQEDAQQQAEQQRHLQAAAQMQRELQAVNGVLDTLRPLWKDIPQSSPLRAYWHSLYGSALPKKEYYSEELTLAIQALRKNYKEVFTLLQKTDSASMPPLPDDSQTAEAIVSSNKIEAFQSAAQALKESAHQVFPLLQQALKAEAAERKQLAQEDQLRSDLATTITNINAVCRKLHKALSGKAVDAEALSVLDTFRQTVGCPFSGLALMIPNPIALDHATEATLRQWMGLANAAQFAVDQYHHQIDQENAAIEQERRWQAILLKAEEKAAEEKAEREEKLRSDLPTAISTFNQQLRVLEVLQGNTPFDFAFMESLGEFRAAVGSSGEHLAAIRITRSKLAEYNETQLAALCEQLKDLTDSVEDDKKNLRDRNRDQLSQTLATPLKQFNAALKAFRGVSTVFPNELALVILDLNEKMSGQKAWKPFAELAIDAKKVEVMPPEQHQAIADELQDLTAKITAKQSALQQEKLDAQRQQQAKQEALTELQSAVTQLNRLVPSANQILAKGGALTLTLLIELNELTVQLEAPAGWSFFASKKIVSTETVLQTISFDKKHCDNNTTDQLKVKVQTVGDFSEKLKTALKEITEKQILPSQLNQAEFQESSTTTEEDSESVVLSSTPAVLTSTTTTPAAVAAIPSPSTLGSQQTVENKQEQQHAVKAVIQNTEGEDPINNNLDSRLRGNDVRKREDDVRRQRKHGDDAKEVRGDDVKASGDDVPVVHHPWASGTRPRDPGFSPPVLTSLETGKGEPELSLPELQQACTNLYAPLLKALKEKTKDGDERRTQFEKQVKAVKADNKNPEVLKAALAEFRQIEEELQEIEPKVSSRDSRSSSKLRAPRHSDVPPSHSRLSSRHSRVGGNPEKTPFAVLTSTITTTTAVAAIPSPSTLDSQQTVENKQEQQQHAVKAVIQNTEGENPINDNLDSRLRGNDVRKREDDVRKQRKHGNDVRRSGNDVRKHGNDVKEEHGDDVKASGNDVPVVRHPRASVTSPGDPGFSFSLKQKPVFTNTKNKNPTNNNPDPRLREDDVKTSRDDVHKREDDVRKERGDSVTLFAPAPTVKIEQRIAKNKQDQRKVIDLLNTFKYWILDGARYSLKYHFNLLIENGGITPEEFYHLKSLLDYLDGINESVKARVIEIGAMPAENLLDYNNDIKRVNEVTQTIELLLQSLVATGTADYESPLALSEDKASTKNLKDINLGMAAWWARRNLLTQTTPHTQSPVGIYNNLPDLFAALSHFVMDHKGAVNSKVLALNFSSSQPEHSRSAVSQTRSSSTSEEQSGSQSGINLR